MAALKVPLGQEIPNYDEMRRNCHHVLLTMRHYHAYPLFIRLNEFLHRNSHQVRIETMFYPGARSVTSAQILATVGND
jgi:hypothetical protein